MRYFTTVHLLLLAYIISALLFWGISLQKHSQRIYELETQVLNTELSRSAFPDIYQSRLADIEAKRDSRTKQYWGEGSTFMIIILIGAAVVYSSFRRSVRLSKQQNNFMLSVTHELKSPIAAMKLNLQTLQRHQLDEDKKNLLISRCINEANRLNDMSTNMLFASQIEGRQYKSSKEKMSISELLSNCVMDYATRYPNRFEVKKFEDYNIVGDRILLQMAINNLLENANKYTPNDQPVQVNISSSSRQVTIKVIDFGVGIPDSEKSKIFNKFYRVGNEETRKTKGTGLGLYLTKKIIRQHKGKIAVKDNQPHGAIFEITLPLAS